MGRVWSVVKPQFDPRTLERKTPSRVPRGRSVAAAIRVRALVVTESVRGGDSAGGGPPFRERGIGRARRCVGPESRTARHNFPPCQKGCEVILDGLPRSRRRGISQ
jgi:hypothetical protein